MTTALKGLLAAVCLCCFLSEAHCAQLQLSMGLPHYAREMEFYYLHPRVEIIPDMLTKFVSAKVLEKVQNRWMLSAFLAELLRDGALKFPNLVKATSELGKLGRELLGLSAHLADSRDYWAFCQERFEPEDAVFISQITATPTRLEDWDMESEPSIVQMYWAAFMASGKARWVDAIITVAKNWAIDRANGRRVSGSGQAAAASLYEFAPRHEAVKEAIIKHASKTSGPARDMLNLILENAG